MRLRRLRVFGKCQAAALKHITLLHSLAIISENTFEGCDSLTSIAIPDSVRVILGSAGGVGIENNHLRTLEGLAQVVS